MIKSEKVSIEDHFCKKLNMLWFSKPTKYIIHVGPTNSGKTFSAVQSLKQSSNGIYLSPLRLLAWEIYDKLNLDGVFCSLYTGEEKITVPDSTVTACTIEMCNNDTYYDIAVIDECFMIADMQRGKHWLNAILGINAHEVHIITNIESKGLIINLLTATNNIFEIFEYERKVPLEISDDDIKLKNLLPKTILVVFSRMSVLYYKYMLNQLGKKCSVLYGNLPPEVKRNQIRAFVNGDVDVLVTTDVIGMGINLPCNQIVFLEDSKFDGEDVRKLNEKEIKQISGRAGRYGLSTKGIVTALDQSFLLDIEKAFNSMIEETKGVYGLDGEIYKAIPEDTPKMKIKSFKTLNFLPSVLRQFLKIEELELYTPMVKHYDLSLLNDDFAWAFLSCPTNNQNITFWRHAVSCTAHFFAVHFNEKYSLNPITDIKQLEYAEADISNIDLVLYMFNNKILKPLFQGYNTDYMEVLKLHKQIIIDNINTYFLTVNIKQKEIKFAENPKAKKNKKKK
jgi:ATP-dependent RNA helicase SUPV3L1/SUV3